MPLLHRKPFVAKKIPGDWRDSDEVFFCRMTKEAFKNYDEYCERVILCNSLVWSCSLTGRSHLTYKEAAASEDKVKGLLKKFPMELRIPVLYLASICERKSLVELAEEVYNFVKDRYFIGETVQVQLSDGLKTCHVLAVIPPNDVKSPSKKDKKSLLPASSYQYEVERHDTNEEITVPAKKVSRKKNLYNKDQNRLYIKQFVHLVDGFWKLKEDSNSKYGISRVKFNQIFCGNPPDLNIGHSSSSSTVKTAAKKKQSSNSKKQQSALTKYFKPTDKKPGPIPANSKSSPKKNNRPTLVVNKNKRRTKKEMELAKANAAKLGLKIRDRRKEKIQVQNKMKYNEFVKKWHMKREDLECEDLRDMPSPVPVQCKVPNEYFGDVLMILEFIHCFKNILQLKNFFPYGFTIELLERALTTDELAGPLSDLLQMLIIAVFELQERELDEIKETDLKIATPVVERGTPEMLKLMRLAVKKDEWIKQHHAFSLSDMEIDSSTITEVLRLHLTTSGAVPNRSKLARFRYMTRGLFTFSDDPGAELTLENPQLIKKLGSMSVFNCELDEKLKIIQCLLNQILTYKTTRDIIDERCEEAKKFRTDLKVFKAEQAKKEKEQLLLKIKDKKDGKPPETPAEEKKPVESTEDNEEESAEKRALRGRPGVEKEKTAESIERDIRDALAGAQLEPLGTDRAHRRYWTFSCMAGLFVEHDNQFVGPCLPKCTPQFSYVGSSDADYIKRLFEESSNKENIATKGVNQTSSNSNSPSKKLLAEQNGSGDTPRRQRSKSDASSPTPVTTIQRPLTCWADSVNCPVHGSSAERVKWAFFSDADSLENLIKCLNVRGVRERVLKQMLVQEKANIVRGLPDVPVASLNHSTEVPAEVMSVMKVRLNKIMKRYENSRFGYPDDMNLEVILEKSFRDLILETEERINDGALGSLKVKDRRAWREAIANNGYDSQCKNLVWGVRDTEDDGEGSQSDTGSRDELMDEVKEEKDEDVKEKMEVDVNEDMNELKIDEQERINGAVKEELDSVTDAVVGDVKKESEPDESRSTSPSLPDVNEEREENKKDLIETVTQRPLIADLASALLQLAQSVELKFVKRPLGLDKKERDKAGHPSTATLAMQRWEETVMESTSLSQLYLLFNTFQKSVLWDRSALFAFCRICLRKRDPESMLLCDTCNKGHHLYCLKPKLKKVPAGEWHCFRCRPKFQNKKNVSEEDKLSSETCTTCGELSPQLSCETCPTKIHLSCANPPLRRIPSSKWVCRECRVQNSQAKKLSAQAAADSEEHEEEEDGGQDEAATPVMNGFDDSTVTADTSVATTNGLDPDWSGAGDSIERRRRPVKRKPKRSESPAMVRPERKARLKVHKVVESEDSYSDMDTIDDRGADDYSLQSDRLSYTSNSNIERLSRRKCSRAATAKISQFAKQLRSSHWDENGELDESELRDAPQRSRRSRRSLETFKHKRESREDLPLDNAALLEILDRLMHHKDAWPFLRPVSKSEVPDYHVIIKKPMDFATIKHKLNMLEYTKNHELLADTELLFDNCSLYNKEGSEVYTAGENLRKLFHKLCKQFKLVVHSEEEEDDDVEFVEDEPQTKRPRTVL